MVYSGDCKLYLQNILHRSYLVENAVRGVRVHLKALDDVTLRVGYVCVCIIGELPVVVHRMWTILLPVLCRGCNISRTVPHRGAEDTWCFGVRPSDDEMSGALAEGCKPVRCRPG